MPNFKKFVALSLGAVVLLASCTRGVDANGAKKFIRENYSGTDTYIGIDNVQLSLKVTCSDDIKTEMIETVKKYAEDVKCKDDEYKDGALSFTCKSISKESESYKSIDDTCKTRLSEEYIDYIEEYKGENTKYVYTTSGKEMSIYGTKSVTKENLFYKQERTIIYGDNGHSRYVRDYKKTKKDNTEYVATLIYVVSFAK